MRFDSGLGSGNRSRQRDLQEEGGPKVISDFSHESRTGEVDHYFGEGLDSRRNRLEGKILV